jgi:rSAM/selenodomain-associated transferase 1
MPNEVRVVILTKAPVPGQVKTRLIPALGAEGACRLHTAMARETIRRAVETGLPVTLSVAGPLDHPFVEQMRPVVHAVEQQVEGHLGDRLIHAMAGPGRRIALGTDCPHFDPAWLLRAAQSAAPVCLGPAEDGGYWTIAIDAPRPDLFRDIPWSTGNVFQATLERARQADLEVEVLPRCYDIDQPASLEQLRRDRRCPPSLIPVLTPA